MTVVVVGIHVLWAGAHAAGLASRGVREASGRSYMLELGVGEQPTETVRTLNKVAWLGFSHFNKTPYAPWIYKRGDC